MLAAAFALLGERGYAGLTFEAVAERAAVAKTTIYRWWPDRAALAVDAFLAATADALAFPDAGSAREDFRLQILQLARLLRGPVGAAMAAMVGGARTEPAMARAIGERWVAPRKRWGAERLERAQRDGECAPDLDVAAALDLLYGPLYARLLLGLGAPDDALVERHLAVAFRGIFAAGR